MPEIVVGTKDQIKTKDIHHVKKKTSKKILSELKNKQKHFGLYTLEENISKQQSSFF